MNACESVLLLLDCVSTCTNCESCRNLAKIALEVLEEHKQLEAKAQDKSQLE